MDGIMKKNSKFSISILLIPLVVFALVKIIWVSVETFVLPHSGINHVSDDSVKPLFYRVKLVKQEYIKPAVTKKPKKPVASIKDIKLIGIYSSPSVVVVTVVYKNKTKVLSKGDKINGFVLTGGTNDYALFKKNNKHYKVDLIKNHPNSKSSIKVVKQQQPKQDTKDLSDGVVEHQSIDRDLFEHFANNMDEIYKNIGIKEIKKGDKKVFKVSFIKRGSPFAKLGIKRGDIIKSINGQTIDSYSAAFNAYRGIKNANVLNVVVIRNNKELELEYEIN